VALPANLSSPTGADRLAGAALEIAGRVDLLVAGAGVGWAGTFAAMPPAVADQVLAVNLLSAIRLVRPLPPERAAATICGAAARHRAEIYVPGWLRLPGIVRAVTPALFRHLTARFG
jgi:NAD(P)-dependent dehydrogenase (short-subunit alcohol dehydrogenase family)